MIEYEISQASGNPTVPTAATLTIAPAKGATAVATDSGTVTDNTTTYTVRYEVAAATMAALEGAYYYQSQETFAAEPVTVTKLQGQLYVGEDVA